MDPGVGREPVRGFGEFWSILRGMEQAIFAQKARNRCFAVLMAFAFLDFCPFFGFGGCFCFSSFLLSLISAFICSLYEDFLRGAVHVLLREALRGGFGPNCAEFFRCWVQMFETKTTKLRLIITFQYRHGFIPAFAQLQLAVR